MATSSKYQGPADILTLYDVVVDGLPDVERKGAKTPYTSRNGHMFSFLDPTGVLALRLSPAARDAFLSEFATARVVQHGSLMKEYVEVPLQLLHDTAAVREWFTQSYDYVGTLTPKASTRPRPIE